MVTVDTESFANGWHNPYLYDGKDGVRYDTETGLYWMSVRAYDPTLGRFISRDPLGRAPLMGWSTQPYAYAGNNPLLNVDPSGHRFAAENGAQAQVATNYQRHAARMYTCDHACWRGKAQGVAGWSAAELTAAGVLLGLASVLLTTFAGYLAGIATNAAEAAVASAAVCFVCAIAFAGTAALFASMALVAAQIAFETRWLAAEAGFLAAAFGLEAYNGGLTSKYIEHTFKPRLTAIVSAFVVARLLSSFRKLWTKAAGAEHLIGGLLNSILVGGTLLAWSLGRANQMEYDLPQGGL